jgi:SAM-dependent methyltransferase
MSNTRCPISGAFGSVVSSREPEELFSAYGRLLGANLPEIFRQKYFISRVFEYESRESGLRWFAPALPGDGAYYAALADMFSWYYDVGSWDKVTCLKAMLAARLQNVLEIGCGEGRFLENLASVGLEVSGVDLNPTAVRRARERNLNVFLPGEIPRRHFDAICMLQTIEHLQQPLEFLRESVRNYKPNLLFLSAPCFESFLGVINDPLVWPPHHMTFWSERAFRVLGRALGFAVQQVAYDSMDYPSLQRAVAKPGLLRENARMVTLLSKSGRIGFRVARKLGFRLTRRHSIFVVMKK